MENNSELCSFCHNGGTEIKSSDQKWWTKEAENDCIPFVRGTAFLNPLPEMEIHLDQFNQHIVSDTKNFTYPLSVGFRIYYCPICGRKLNYMDETLMNNLSFPQKQID